MRKVAPGRGHKPMADSGRSLNRDSEAVVSSVGVGDLGGEKAQQQGKWEQRHWPGKEGLPGGTHGGGTSEQTVSGISTHWVP